MLLLERDQYISELETLFKQAKDGNGCIAAISGEAGIGKTSLVDFFSSQTDCKKIYWGICDDLFTPRPLSPLYDIAAQLKSKVLAQLESGTQRSSIFSNLIKDIELNQPNIIIIEDLHWGDESTFDLINFIGRRINKLKSLLIITYRDDEVKAVHPLKISLSTIPSQNLKRLKLNPLSIDAVKQMAESFKRSDKNIFNRTGGNPFLVTELLSSQDEGIPVTIKDLINSKLIKLPTASKEVVEILSVIPGRVEKWLIKELVSDLSLIEMPVEIGILKSDHESISFRHELGRLTVEESLSDAKRIKYNSEVISVLLNQKNINYYLARIIHHAEKSHSADVIIKYAPLAAKQASQLGAHYQASKHYLTALQISDHMDHKQQVQMLEGRAYECMITGQIDEGIQSCKSIIKILESYSDLHKEAETYRKLSRLLWYGGQDDEGESYLKKAISILEELDSKKNLAMAYSNLSQVYMCREDTNLAVRWGEKALELSREISDIEIEIHALCNLGSAKMFAESEDGEKLLKQSLELSLKNNFHDDASRAYANIGSAYLYRRNITEADKYFSIGLQYCNEKDLYTHGLCISAETSKTKLYSGDWDSAIDFAGVIFNNDSVPIIDRVISLCVTGIIRARRNDPGALKLIDEAFSVALKTGELMKIVTATSALAEYYWLNNKLEEVSDKIELIFNKYKTNRNSWAVGELTFWIWKAGQLKEIPENIAQPFLLQVKNKWKEAAIIWEQLNCPYEQALALIDGDESAKRKALELFNFLGASATVQLIKKQMREAGIKNIPKGPQQATRENPAGLTKRQYEILTFVAEGLSNSEIASRLYISPKTVDHHISAILSKLNIRSRTEAAAFLYSKNMK